MVDGRFAEAERELERLKRSMRKTERNRGYFRALYGMLIVRRSNSDRYSFFSRLSLSDKRALRDYRREFLAHASNKLHGDFDRGFFSAWADCMYVLSSLTAGNLAKSGSAVSRKASDGKGSSKRSYLYTKRQS